MTAPRHSAIYRGRVRHRRYGAVSHEFAYDLFMLYLDLDELDTAFDGRWLWSVGRPNLASFRRADYLTDPDDPDKPLKQTVLDRVRAHAGSAPDGPVRMLTHPAYFGFCFNPVTFYYCFDRDERLAAIVAEITNTPWRERHAYVLTREDDLGEGGRHRWAFRKDFHVSPFIDMDQDYEWLFDEPDERLAVHMENRKADRLTFDATLTMERAPLDRRGLATSLIAHPFMTGKVLLGIYWQALRLRLKHAPFHAHPSTLSGGVS
jgi:DUF1365 family protein